MMLLIFQLACYDGPYSYSREYESQLVEYPTYETDIVPIWREKCRGCHLDGASRGGLSLSRPASSIVNGASSQARDIPLVTPNAPASSYLYLKLEGSYMEAGGSGMPMPVGAGLDPAALATVYNWIATGAPSDIDLPEHPNWEEHVGPLLEASCTSSGCHDGTQPPKLTAADGYDALVGVRSSGGTEYVSPGDSSASYLIKKLSDAPPSGSQMPLGIDPLSEDIQIRIAAWIDDGAPENASDTPSEEFGGPMIALLFSVAAFAQARAGGPNLGVDEDCTNVSRPGDYSEEIQQANLLNSAALAMSFSPMHGALPHRPGEGGVDVRVSVIPPMSCEERFALAHRKTEDTNKSPVYPMIAISYAFPSPRLTPYFGAGFVATPMELRGARVHAASGEAGAAIALNGWQKPAAHSQLIGLRVHSTISRTTGELALPIADPELTGATYNDVLVATTSGADLIYTFVPLSAGSAMRVETYAAVGIVDVGTFFWVGDDGVVGDNLYPYRGPAMSLGGVLSRGTPLGSLVFGLELYAAPGGTHPLFETSETPAFGSTGNLKTVRFRLGFEPEKRSGVVK